MNYHCIDQFDHDSIMNNAKLLHSQQMGVMTIKLITHDEDDLMIVGPVEGSGNYIVIDGNSEAYDGSAHDHVRYCVAKGLL
ncbi:hypothetical protein [Chitinilyticum piscinae]|uniref:Uncharacterized protein n=1 Tax=Chitinilyticum piscinae TaxID=2866724 RepID=A0A8J7FV75_9NEIS|nr:hypothetical protein [Chitinilyticum piscinae]MBE9607865.1 hypothetical protein [Chitinilyticum piscinae]